jgi:hypothetical protein
VNNGVPAVVIVAPAFERQAHAYGKNLGLPPERILVLPIGKLSPDAEESVPKIREATQQSFADIQEGWRVPVSRIER